MSSYRVLEPFMAFQREYKRGIVLTDADLECWQPETDRSFVIEGLRAQGKIDPIGADEPDGGYPATFGSNRPTNAEADPPGPL